MTHIELDARPTRRLIGSALLALVLVLAGACGDDDSDAASDPSAEHGALPSDVEDLIEDADDLPEPVCDEELLTLEEISEATDLDFVACDSAVYRTADNVRLDLQHTVYGSADEASAQHEGFSGTEPTSGDGWEGAARENLVLGSAGEHYFSAADQTDDGVDRSEVLHKVIDALAESAR